MFQKMNTFNWKRAVVFLWRCFGFQIASLARCTTVSVAIDSISGNDINGYNLLSDVRRPTVILHAIPLSERRQWWKHIQTRSKNELVQVDRQNIPGILEQELVHALELIESSLKAR
jgi:hypothetical protein